MNNIRSTGIASLLILIASVVYPDHLTPPDIPHKTVLTSSPREIASTDTFTVHYELSEVLEGHYYVAVDEEKVEVIGQNTWEGDIKNGETKILDFTLKVKNNPLVPITDKRIVIIIRFSPEPFGMRIHGYGAMTFILLKDFEQVRFRRVDYDSLAKE